MLTGVQEAWIDVRDVAMAHINAIEQEKAGGERFIITSGSFTYQDFCTLAFLLVFAFSNLINFWCLLAVDIGNEVAASDSSLGVTFIKGPQPGFGKTLVYRRTYSNQKSIDLLGMTYNDKKKTLLDTVADFKAKGWL